MTGTLSSRNAQLYRAGPTVDKPAIVWPVEESTRSSVQAALPEELAAPLEEDEVEDVEDDELEESDPDLAGVPADEDSFDVEPFEPASDEAAFESEPPEDDEEPAVSDVLPLLRESLR
jgi:hypothetical protein